MANDYYDDPVDDADDASAPAQHFTSMIQIEPFDAESDDEERLRVVGIVADASDDTFDFIAIKTLENGEMIPVREGSVWPVRQRKAVVSSKRKTSLYIV